MKTTKAAKEITILKRAEIKKASVAYNVHPGDLIFIVKGEAGSIHETILRNNGRHSCTCKANASFGRNCYHIKGCEKVNNARVKAAKVAIEVVEVPEIVESKEDRAWAVYRSELAKQLAQQYMTTQIVEEIMAQLLAPAKTPVAKIIEQAVQATVPVPIVTTDLSKRGNFGTRAFSVLR